MVQLALKENAVFQDREEDQEMLVDYNNAGHKIFLSRYYVIGYEDIIKNYIVCRMEMMALRDSLVSAFGKLTISQ